MDKSKTPQNLPDLFKWMSQMQEQQHFNAWLDAKQKYLNQIRGIPPNPYQTRYGQSPKGQYPISKEMPNLPQPQHPWDIPPKPPTPQKSSNKSPSYIEDYVSGLATLGGLPMMGGAVWNELFGPSSPEPLPPMRAPPPERIPRKNMSLMEVLNEPSYPNVYVGSGGTYPPLEEVLSKFPREVLIEYLKNSKPK